MKICVLGSGSWGTALAQVLADNHHEVVVWGKSPEEIADLKLHRNTKYFPEVLVNPAIEATLDFDTVKTADILLLAVPTGAVEEVSGPGCLRPGSSGDCDQRRQGIPSDDASAAQRSDQGMLYAGNADRRRFSDRSLARGGGHSPQADFGQRSL